MDEAIVKYLKRKTRVLVTHQLRVLAKADRIVYLDKGGVRFKGTFAELKKSSIGIK